MRTLLDARPRLWTMVKSERLITLYGALCACGLGAGQNRPEGSTQPTEADIERLVQDLLSDESKTRYEARKQLERTPHVVPVLFKKLVEADWDLRPPLLDVLSETKGGRDYARLKLFHGSTEEKTYAALLYELIDVGENRRPGEYAAMVEVLLKALKSEDKNLRAAAALALLHDEPHSLFFEHLHELVPAMISSFDTPVVLDRGVHDVSSGVFIGICTFLDALIGGRVGYLGAESTNFRNAQKPGLDRTISPQQGMVEFLAANRTQIEKLRRYWQDWWDNHAKLTPVEIGVLVIERNIPLLQRDREDEQRLTAEYSLELWTMGMYVATPEDWAFWWAEHKDNYQGPIIKGE